MKLIKLFTREYTLLEHELILLSLIDTSATVPEIQYSFIADISRKEVIDIYINKKDFEENTKRIILAVKNRNYINKMLDGGIVALRELRRLPKNLPKRIKNLSEKQIIQELYKLKRKAVIVSGFLDFTHYLGKSDIVLTDNQVKKLSSFHDYRKLLFIDYFKFLSRICSKIAKRRGLKSNNLQFLTFNEIVLLLQGKISLIKADQFQRERKKHYILIIKNGKEEVISKNFDKVFKKLKKMMIKDKKVSELKGFAINKGIVRGRVFHLSTKEDFSKVPQGKIIVTHMTNPDMTLILKKSLAIVTDDGGLLCHAANVAREFKIIAVIGTKNATKVLKDGDLVEVDANKGIVKKINK